MITELAIGSFAIGCLVMMWNMNRNVSKVKDNLSKEVEILRSGVSDKYVRKEVCKIVSKQVHDDIIEIKHDVKTLLRKNGVN